MISAPVVVSNVGMIHHAQLFAKSYNLQFATTKEALNYENIYQFGIYRPEDYLSLINRKQGKVLLQWCGQDAFDFVSKRKLGIYDKDLPNFIEHIAQSINQVNILKTIGINAKIVRRFCDRKENYPLTNLPEKFSIVVYNNSRTYLYCIKELTDIIKKCSDIQFILLGEGISLSETNVKMFNISLLNEPEKYRNILKESSCLLRFIRDGLDGFSQLVMQMLLLGRRVIGNIEQENVEKFDIQNEKAIINRLYELKQIKESNYEGSWFYHNRPDINNFEFLV